jgi:hypothetical protein
MGTPLHPPLAPCDRITSSRLKWHSQFESEVLCPQLLRFWRKTQPALKKHPGRFHVAISVVFPRGGTNPDSSFERVVSEGFGKRPPQHFERACPFTEVKVIAPKPQVSLELLHRSLQYHHPQM